MKYSAGNEFGVNYCECLFLGRDPGSGVRDPGSDVGEGNRSSTHFSDHGSRKTDRDWTNCVQMRYHYAPPEGWMGDEKPSEGRWEQLNKCPECGEDMKRDAAVGERIGLFYRCAKHGRFRYSWDHDRLERE